MPIDHPTKISFAFKIHRAYDDILSLKVEDDIVPAGEAALPYLCQRLNAELCRVTGQRLPSVTPEDRGREPEAASDDIPF
jgi:hypothetical protein